MLWSWIRVVGLTQVGSFSPRLDFYDHKAIPHPPVQVNLSEPHGSLQNHPNFIIMRIFHFFCVPYEQLFICWVSRSKPLHPDSFSAVFVSFLIQY